MFRRSTLYPSARVARGKAVLIKGFGNGLDVLLNRGCRVSHPLEELETSRSLRTRLTTGFAMTSSANPKLFEACFGRSRPGGQKVGAG